MASEEPTRRLKTTETSFAVLNVLVERNGARVSEVAKQLGISKSSAHYHLSTLRDLQYVVAEGDIYHVGLKFAYLGEFAKHRIDGYERIVEITEDLAERSNFVSGFCIEEHGRARYLKPEDEAMYHPEPGDGKSVYLHSTAAGKAMLAELPTPRVEEILDEVGLPAQTENTITDREALFSELERIRERGYAINDSENKDGIKAVGVAVWNNNRTILGSLSLSGPKYRADGKWFEEEMSEALFEARENVKEVF